MRCGWDLLKLHLGFKPKSGLRKHGKEPFLFLFFCLFSSAGFWVCCDPITQEAAISAIEQWNWITDKNTMAEPGAAFRAWKSSSAALPWLQGGAVGGAHVGWVKGHIDPSCTYSSPLWDSPVSPHNPLNPTKGWWQLASLYTSFQTVLATRLPRIAPKSNKTKGRVGAHESVRRRLIWTWMEGKLPAGQSYCCLLTQIFVMEACFSDRWR